MGAQDRRSTAGDRVSLNADWHRAHPMPKHPTFEQHLEWHREHAKACGCRKPPPAIAALLREEQQAQLGARPEHGEDER